MEKAIDISNSDLLHDLCEIINTAKTKIAVSVNGEMTMMYWNVGKRINHDVLDNQRAKYGEQIVSQVATQLQSKFGKRGFELRNIRRMMQFAACFDDEQIVSQLATQISWSHFLEVLPLKGRLRREFYIALAVSGNWGRNRLRKEIDGMLYERTAISKQPDTIIEQALADLRNNNIITPDLVFKNPYFLDFTGLTGCYSEKSLEDTLVANLEKFIVELGNGFCFVERQKRMIIDGEDFYLDLLFYHRQLHRLIAIDLKMGRFKAQYKGQMELYLRWLEANEMGKGEDTPLGLLLCTEGNEEQIELLQLDKAGIKVAKYMTELPPRDILVSRIKQSLAMAKTNLLSNDADKTKE